MRLKLFLVFAALSGLLALPSFAQDSSSGAPAPKKDGQAPTVSKPMTDKQRKKQEDKLRKELETPFKKWLNEDVDLHHHRRREQGVQGSADRRRTRAVHRAILAAPRPHARYRRKRISRRALPPHRVRQRPLRFRHSGLENRPRHDLHQVWRAGRNRDQHNRRHLRTRL